MNVWLVNHYALRPTEAGGTRHYILGRELLRRGHNPAIIASSFDHYSRTDGRVSRGHSHAIETVNGVRFLWLRTPAYSGLGAARILNMGVFAARVLSGTAQRLLPRPDVIIGSSPSLFAALAAERLSARLGVPFVLEVRDLWPESLLDLMGASERHPFVLLLTAIEKWLYKRAVRIISLLPNAAEHMVNKGANREKIIWLPNGVDLQSLPNPSPPAPKPTFTVAYVGTHNLANALDTVLDCAGIMQRDGESQFVHFRFVGNGEEKARLVERARAEKLSNVTFQDPVPKSDIFGVYEDADACVLETKDVPLYRFGVSMNKLHEYMAAARPVIYGGNAPKNPVCLANAGFVIPPEDPVKLCEAVKQLARMPIEQRWEMGQRGRRFIERHNDFAIIAAELEELLLSVAPPPNSDRLQRNAARCDIAAKSA